MELLLRWIAQGVVLVAVVAMALHGRRGISAAQRYRVWWTAMVLVLLLPILDALDLPGAGAVLGFSASDAAVAPLAGAAGNAGTSPPVALSTWLLLGGGALWMLRGAGRLWAALAHLEAAKRGSRPFPCARERRLARWKTIRNRGRRAMLVTSDRVRSAGVLGLGYPRIAVNDALLARLSDEEVDQVVLHEYAHVQRHDDVIGALQMGIQLLAGWHPAVWWIDRQLKIEREVACDDWVLQATAAPRAYASCLTRMAELSQGAEPLLIPAMARRSSLSTRIVRLLDARRSTAIRPSGVTWAMSGAMLLILSIGLAGRQTALPEAGATAAVAAPAMIAAAGTGEPESDATAGAEPPDAADAPLAARDARSEADETVDVAEDVTEDVTEDVAAVRDTINAGFRPASDAVHASLPVTAVRRTAHEEQPVALPAVHIAAAVLTSAAAPGATPDTDAVVAGAAPADAETVADADEASWPGSTGRAVANAGRLTGRTIADAGVDTGSAFADAGTAAASGSRKAAVKTARFFSRIGKSLSKPF